MRKRSRKAMERVGVCLKSTNTLHCLHLPSKDWVRRFATRLVLMAAIGATFILIANLFHWKPWSWAVGLPLLIDRLVFDWLTEAAAESSVEVLE